VMIQKPSEREDEWVQANRKDLVERIARVMHEQSFSVSPKCTLFIFQESCFTRGSYHARRYFGETEKPCHHRGKRTILLERLRTLACLQLSSCMISGLWRGRWTSHDTYNGEDGFCHEY
jgi:hypothetical protein